MNTALEEAKRKFRGQMGTVTAGFDNAPIPDGKYVCEVVKSEITPDTKYKLHLRIALGEFKGRYLFPFAPALTELDGIIQCVKTLRAIRGDVIPGSRRPNGEFEVDVGRFLAQVEELVASCEGERVEAQVKKSRTQRDDGTFWQNVYVNRGLGEDAARIVEGGGAEVPVDRRKATENLELKGGATLSNNRKPVRRRRSK